MPDYTRSGAWRRFWEAQSSCLSILFQCTKNRHRCLSLHCLAGKNQDDLILREFAGLHAPCEQHVNNLHTRSHIVLRSIELVRYRVQCDHEHVRRVSSETSLFASLSGWESEHREIHPNLPIKTVYQVRGPQRVCHGYRILATARRLLDGPPSGKGRAVLRAEARSK